MRCPKCDGKLAVTTTYQAGGAATTQRVECDALRSGCGFVGAVMAVLMPEPSRGDQAVSAFRLARQIRNGTEPDSLITSAKEKTAGEAV